MIIQNNRKRTPAIISILGDDKENKGEETPSGGELEHVAQELISAVHEKDVAGTVSALRACYACLESEDSGEG